MSKLLEQLTRTPVQKMKDGETYIVNGMHGFDGRYGPSVILHTDKGQYYCPAYIVNAAVDDLTDNGLPANSVNVNNVFPSLMDALNGRVIICTTYTTKQGTEGRAINYADVDPDTGEYVAKG